MKLPQDSIHYLLDDDKEPLTYYPVWARAYAHPIRISREEGVENHYETHEEVILNRIIPHLQKLMIDAGVLGGFAYNDKVVMAELMLEKKVFPSGRFLWVGGRPWAYKQENFSGMYNCVSMDIESFDDIVELGNLAMQGCGTGAVLLREYVDKLPTITTSVVLKGVKEPAKQKKGNASTIVELVRAVPGEPKLYRIITGDSRQGWCDTLAELLMMFSTKERAGTIELELDLSNVRVKGIPLKGFGGVSNPDKLSEAFINIIEVLNGAVGRKLTPYEVCLIIDNFAYAVVAGGIRRSAGMRQFDADTPDYKAGLYQWNPTDGSFTIDPKKKCLTMANHTKVYFHIPTIEEVLRSVESQFKSGEGAFMYAPNAIDRGGNARRFGLNPCGEINGNDFHCNLTEVHLNRIAPHDFKEQDEAFRIATLVALPLLSHKFINPKMQKSRLEDPIVGVSFTGLFDFFVKAMGRDWLDWMMEGRPQDYRALKFEQIEINYLESWKHTVNKTADRFFAQHGKLFGKRPTRLTTVQPAGTKSLLTNASPGWHPPKALRYVRRITVAKQHPVAQASLAFGFGIVPAQSSVDDKGNYISDINDPRVYEWLIEVPVKVPWADVAEGIDINQLPAISQLQLYMQVQRYYTEHNTSGTVELREGEIQEVAYYIHDQLLAGEPYISVALLPRIDSQYPLLPFEPCSEEEYQKRLGDIRTDISFEELLDRELSIANAFDVSSTEEGPAGCDSDKCLL